MNLTMHPRPIALLGHPVGHSHSPLIHNTAFAEANLPFIYLTCDVVTTELAAAVRGLGALGFRGANVTLPHKNAVIEFMDELTPQAQATRAVNTIVCEVQEAGAVRYTGDNTDVTGFIASIQPVIEGVMDQPALVLGSGGASRAVVYALSTTLRASSITLAARNTEKAQRMLEELNIAGDADVIPFSEAPSAIAANRFIINTTPLGMYPDAERTPIDDPSFFNPDHLVYDLIYRPRRTRMLEEAAANGASVIGGIEMLIGQAAASFARWTGREMPIERVRERLEAL